MTNIGEECTFLKINREHQLPDWANHDVVVQFFHETMKPWHDRREDIVHALDYAFSDAKGEGGFLMLAAQNRSLVGALLMLNTGMIGYVPEHLLLFVSVDPSQRGSGLGTKIIRRSIAECKGNVKLHVEYENPAKRLYERLGFTSKYAEMRFTQ
jgi:ribosomal-protein-alanine N-acetyltransferase